MTILVTGASGFIGSFICSEGLRQGLEVWAGMRGTSSSQYLTDPRLKFATLSLERPDELRQQLRRYKEQLGGRGWDYVVHAAGATKSLTREGFFRTNTEGTRHLVEALQAEGMVPRRFVFMNTSKGSKRKQKSSSLMPMVLMIGTLALLERWKCVDAKT